MSVFLSAFLVYVLIGSISAAAATIHDVRRGDTLSFSDIPALIMIVFAWPWFWWWISKEDNL